MKDILVNLNYKLYKITESEIGITI